MERLLLTVHGTAVPKGRPRTVPILTRNGHYKTNPLTGRILHRTYTPESTERWQDTIRVQALLVMQGYKLHRGAVMMKAVFYLPYPKGMPAEEREYSLPMTGPDLDNLVKALMDAFNKIVWKDDGQVIEARMSKRYSDHPRVEVEIMLLDDEDVEKLLDLEQQIEDYEAREKSSQKAGD